LTVPLALPLLPLVTVNQLELLDAVHEQPLVVVTVLLPGPPSLASDALVGDTVKAHAAASVTVIVCPATVKVPLRDELVVFAAAV
jgi:hypothetical protein